MKKKTKKENAQKWPKIAQKRRKMAQKLTFLRKIFLNFGQNGQILLFANFKLLKNGQKICKNGQFYKKDVKKWPNLNFLKKKKIWPKMAKISEKCPENSQKTPKIANFEK